MWILQIFIYFWVVASMIVAPGDAQQFENLTFIFGIPTCFWISSGIMEHGTGQSASSATQLSAQKREYPFITGACFFVYYIHMVNFGNWNLLSWANQVGSQIFNLELPAVASIAYLAEIALIMAAGILAYWLLKRFLPRLSGIITRGR